MKAWCFRTMRQGRLPTGFFGLGYSGRAVQAGRSVDRWRGCRRMAEQDPSFDGLQYCRGLPWDGWPQSLIDSAKSGR